MKFDSPAMSSEASSLAAGELVAGRNFRNARAPIRSFSEWLL